MPTQPRRVASFIVYKDDPVPVAATAKPLPFGTRSANTRVTVSSAHDKENLDPLTGLRPSSGVQSGKKRKTNALASKPVPAPVKPLAESGSPKKRKLTAAPTNERKEKKEKEKRTGSVKKVSRAARVRKATDLPRVEEAEEEAEDKGAEPCRLKDNQLTQAEIDAKCYEFTVLPLADLTRAYDTSSPSDIPPRSEVRESPEFAVDVNAKNPEVETTAQDSKTLPKDNNASSQFSTPERKRIYAAFTFESPSPASRRFASWRESSVSRLPAINFSFNPFEDL